jgi:hypothetical protein
MDNRQPTNQQMTRERAVYRYLDALESGDIDGVMEVLQQATYDAQLEQMILESHQAYFQEEQSQRAALVDMETQAELPASEQMTLHSGKHEQRRSKRRIARWMQVLVATLILGVVVGTFIGALALRRANDNSHPGPGKPTPAVPVCKPSPWQTMNVQQTPGQLNSIAAFSPEDAWAVGGASSLPLIEHWNGQEWSVVDNPTLPDGSGVLNAVAEISPENVWAVGYQSRPSVGQGDTLIEHWDGRQWSIVPSSNGTQSEYRLNTLFSIAAVSANDIWAVGRWDDTDAANKSGTLAEHWNGRTWSVVPDLGDQNRDGILWSVTVAGKQVLAGGMIADRNSVDRAFLERWDGQRWQVVDTTALGPNAAHIMSLSATSEKNVWALVEEYNMANPTVGYVMAVEHWDGQKWSKAPSPAWLVNTENTDVKYISQVFALDNGNVWIVGREFINSMTIRPIVAFWDGKTWKRVNLPAPSDDLTYMNPIALAVSSGAIWVVGESLKGKVASDGHVLIVEQRICP